MKNKLLIAGALIAFAASVLGFLLQQHANKQRNNNAVESRTNASAESVIGSLRPDFTLQDMHGQERHVQEWNNQVLVINFWATWCPPCREEIPGFIKLQKKYNNQGVQFIGIALQTADEVKDYVAELGMNYPVLVGTGDVIKVAERFGNHQGILPYTVIIDRQQHIRFIKRGPLKYEEAETAILAAQ